MPILNYIRGVLTNPLNRFLWFLSAFIFIAAISLIYLSTLFTSSLLKFIFFFCGSYILFSMLLEAIIKFSDFKISIINQRLAAVSLSLGVIIAVFWVPTPISRWLIGGFIAFFFFLFSFASRIVMLLLNTFVPKLTNKSFKSGNDQSVWGMIGVAIFEPGVSTIYGKKILREFLVSKFKSLGESPYFFVDIQTFKKYSHDFCLHAAKSSSGMLIVTRTMNKMAPDFNAELQSYLQLAAGKIFIVQILTAESSVVDVYTGRGIETFNFVPYAKSPEYDDMGSILNKLMHHLTITVVQLGNSDDKLYPLLRSQIQLIANQGLSPLADSYLRFRLSRSNVERFMVLLDCIEIIIKISVMYLSICSWSKNTQENIKSYSLDKPTLGTWITQMVSFKELLKNDEISERINLLLKYPLQDFSLQLYKEATAQGLDWHKSPPKCYEEWFNWFLWIRNSSRGHGVVSEDQITPLWHGFHESFLFLVLNLSPLFINSCIVCYETEDRQISIKGWDRLYSKGNKNDNDKTKLQRVFLETGENNDKIAHSMYPYMVLNAGEVLLWSRTDKGWVEYISYTSGEVFRFNLGHTNPYSLWKSEIEKSKNRSET